MAYSDYTKEQNRSNDTLSSNYSVTDPNSINNPNRQYISVYPNPVSRKAGVLYVNTDIDLQKQNIEVYSAIGKKIELIAITSNTITIPQNLPVGIYFVRIQYDNYILHSSFVISD